MNLVALLDLISFLAPLAGCILLFANWQNGIQGVAKWLFASLLALTFFLGLSNVLEWSGITSVLDKFEDYVELLRPILWIFFFYAFLQEMSENERNNLIHELGLKNTALEQFTYTISHDLKSPIITVKGLAALLRKDLSENNTEQIEHDIGRIENAGDKMYQLLEKLLELSRVGHIIGVRQNIPLADIIHEALNLVNAQLSKKNVQISIPDDLPVVHADLSRFIEIFQNLFDNAVKYMGDQTQPLVKISVRHNDNAETICCVSDNGMGVAEKYHGKIFGVFEKLNSNIEGAGIGLTLIKRIIDAHGCRIWVESEGAGKGSTFCFTLPLAN